MYRFLESIRVDLGVIFYADLHQQRMVETFRNFGKKCSLNIYEIFDNTVCPTRGLAKFRIEYDLDENYTAEIIPYQRPSISSFEICEDPDIDYRFKYADRTAFIDLKIHSTADELIITQNGRITDTTFSNLVFLKNGNWYTPETFLLNGVCRRHLLKTGKIREAAITAGNIGEYSHFQIINAMNFPDENAAFPINAIINYK